MTASLREQAGSWRNTNRCLHIRCTTPPLPASGGSSRPAVLPQPHRSRHVGVLEMGFLTGPKRRDPAEWGLRTTPPLTPCGIATQVPKTDWGLSLYSKKVTKTTTKLEFPAPMRPLLSQQGFRPTRRPINLLRTSVEIKGSCLGLGQLHTEKILPFFFFTNNRNGEGQREATQITETSNYALLLNLQEICSFLTSLQGYSVLKFCIIKFHSRYPDSQQNR